MVWFIELRDLNKSNKRLIQDREGRCFEFKNHSTIKTDIKIISDSFIKKE